MSSPKWSGKPKKFNPSRTFVMSAESSPVRKFNPKSTFMPGSGLSQPGSPSPAAALPQAVAPGSIPPLADQVELLSLYHPPLHPLQYQLYAPTPFRNHLAPPLEPHERRAENFASPEELRKDLNERNMQTLQILPGPTGLPDHVHTYHSLVPLDLSPAADGGGAPGDKDRNVFVAVGDGGAAASSPAVFRYKAVSHTNARTYCLLRVDDFDTAGEHENPLQIVNKWKRVQHSALVGIVEAFTTMAFGTAKPSLVVVYEWFPMSRPLASLKEFPAKEVTAHALWSIAVQLVGALQAIHRRGLACRGVMHEKFVLLQAGSASTYRRVRLGSLGVVDILQGATNGGEGSAAAERQDYIDLGAMLQRLSAGVAPTTPAPSSGTATAPGAGSSAGSGVGLGSSGLGVSSGLGSNGPLSTSTSSAASTTSLATGTSPAAASPALPATPVIATAAPAAPSDFSDLLDALSRVDRARVNELLEPHVFRAADHANRRIDDLEEILAQELENGRVFRLLAKMEFALEGTNSTDPLSKTYALHLFKKFVFGQHSEKGRPSLNFAHALAALNKLDAGIDENVLLVSEDAKTRMIVSYKELKQAFAREFDAKARAV